MNSLKLCFTALSAIVICHVSPLTATPINTPANNFLFLLDKVCPIPDGKSTTQDSSCSSPLAAFYIYDMNADEFFRSKGRKTASDIVDLFNKHDYRKENCAIYKPADACAVAALDARAPCEENPYVWSAFHLLIGFYRTMCSDNFNGLLQDVLEGAGDDCINKVFGFVSGQETNREIISICDAVADEAFYSLQEVHDNFEPTKRIVSSFIDNCALKSIETVCGESSAAAVKRLTDAYLNNLNF